MICQTTQLQSKGEGHDVIEYTVAWLQSKGEGHDAVDNTDITYVQGRGHIKVCFTDA